MPDIFELRIYTRSTKSIRMDSIHCLRIDSYYRQKKSKLENR